MSSAASPRRTRIAGPTHDVRLPVALLPGRLCGTLNQEGCADGAVATCIAGHDGCSTMTSIHEPRENERCEYCLRPVREGDQAVVRTSALSEPQFFWLCKRCYIVQMLRQAELMPERTTDLRTLVWPMWARVTGWAHLARHLAA